MGLLHKVENSTYDVVTISSKMYDFMVQWCDVVITPLYNSRSTSNVDLTCSFSWQLMEQVEYTTLLTLGKERAFFRITDWNEESFFSLSSELECWSSVREFSLLVIPAADNLFNHTTVNYIETGNDMISTDQSRHLPEPLQEGSTSIYSTLLYWVTSHWVKSAFSTRQHVTLALFSIFSNTLHLLVFSSKAVIVLEIRCSEVKQTVSLYKR